MLSLARLWQRQGKRIEAHQLLNASNGDCGVRGALLGCSPCLEAPRIWSCRRINLETFSGGVRLVHRGFDTADLQEAKGC